MDSGSAGMPGLLWGKKWNPSLVQNKFRDQKFNKMKPQGSRESLIVML